MGLTLTISWMACQSPQINCVRHSSLPSIYKIYVSDNISIAFLHLGSKKFFPNLPKMRISAISMGQLELKGFSLECLEPAKMLKNFLFQYRLVGNRSDFIEKKNHFAKVKLNMVFVSDTLYNPFGVRVEDFFEFFHGLTESVQGQCKSGRIGQNI